MEHFLGFFWGTFWSSISNDFSPVLARENLLISGKCDFDLENEVFYYGVPKLKTTAEKQRSM